MSRFNGIIVVALLLLQSCQYTEEAKAENMAQVHRKNDAASYNVELGLNYLKQGNRPRAKKKLLKALELSPSSPNVNSALGYYFEKTGELDEAKKYYNKAISIAPTDGGQLNNYGTFLCRIGKYEESELYFLKATKDVHYIHTAAAFENAGICASGVPNNNIKAANFFIKALERDPQRKQSLYELVTIELKEKHPDVALTYLQKYSALSYNDPLLLAMGTVAAHETKQANIETDFQQRLTKLTNITDNTGVKNEYNSSNG